MSLSQQSFAFTEVAVVPIPLSPTSSCGPAAYTVSQQLFAFPKVEVVDSPCSRCRRCFSVAVHASSEFFSFGADCSCVASLPGAPVSRQNFVFSSQDESGQVACSIFLFKDFFHLQGFFRFDIFSRVFNLPFYNKKKKKKKLRLDSIPLFPS